MTVPYDREGLTAGIVHVGVGGFHRAHQAMVIDRLLEQGLARDWAICGVGILPADERIRDVMRAQDGIYTLVTRNPDGTADARRIGSIIEHLHAPDDPEAVVERMAAPQTRIVSLTITEGGYALDAVTGQFAPEDARLLDEARLRGRDAPRSVFGFVTEALTRRRARGVPPFTVMSCDNIQGNGDAARRAFAGFAAIADPDFGDWIDREVAFPNAMVDRITPRTTPEDVAAVAAEFGGADAWPVVAEPFFQWVLEDHFPAGRPPFDAAGVHLVADVEPYELMKLRLLNASHQALCYFGRLLGHTYVHEAAHDPRIVALLTAYMADEGAPTLQPVPGIDLATYQRTLIERFANAHVRDTIARLCADSSDRIPKWLLPVVRDQLAAGGPVRLAAAIVASWARYAEGVDETGAAIDVVDRAREQVMAAAARQRAEPLAFLRQPDLFGDLVDNERFIREYSWALDALHRQGAAATLDALNRGNTY
ncbi:mannitol dehydrogenase family protein [Dactylosporangium sp. CA-152071]|uniref:mannitol dehydrogenase family protein n=1 Tax=Dactylosporangium sp. CA-152071 TaxID=3239933 RepID=UPI003D8B24E7